MSVRSPRAREAMRLLNLLQAHDRDELWLHVRQYHRLTDQPDQVCVEVIDEFGQVLPDRAGRTCTHTLQVASPALSVVPGQFVHLRRDGEGVWVDILPLVPDVRGSGLLGEIHQHHLVPT